MRNKKLIIIFIVICSFALLILLGSLIFSVRQVEVYCYNYDSNKTPTQTENDDLFTQVDDETIRDAVLALVEDSLMGKSVFLIDDKAIEKKVNSLGYVVLMNVERKFPNRIYINVIKSYRYVQIKLEEGYALLDRDCMVSEIVPERLSPENIINVTLSGPVIKCNVGEKIELSNNDGVILTDILTTLEKLDYEFSKAKALLKSINLSKNGNVYLETHSGVLIKLLGTDYIEEKLRLAVSLFVNYPTMRHSGQITAYRNETQSRIDASYSENSDY